MPLKVTTGCFAVSPEKSGRKDIERRQGSGEVLVGTEESAVDGNKRFDHEVSKIGIGSEARSSMMINRPCLQIGQAFASKRLISARKSERMDGYCGQRASSARHCAIYNRHG